MKNGKIRVVVIDDSSFVRKFLTTALSHCPDIEVVGEAANGRLGLDKIAEVAPDAVTCDIEMPEMDGLETIVEIRKRWPDLPVIMLSTLTAKGAQVSIEALIRGATDIAEKPSGTTGPQEAIKRLEEQIVPKLLMYVGQQRLANMARAPLVPPPPPRDFAAAAAAERTRAEPHAAIEPHRVTRPEPPVRQPEPAAPRSPVVAAPSVAPPSMAAAPRHPRPAPEQRVPHHDVTPSAGPRPAPLQGRPDLIVIGVSTGGPNALADLMAALPGDLAVPVLVVQHMPPVFTKALADRLNQKCPLLVDEARDGIPIAAGQVWIAPGDFHMAVEGKPGRMTLRLSQGPQENGCRPAVDVLFRSAVAVVGGRALAVILTGMGQDGLKGSQALVAAGATLLAQDEATSVVWGMPGAVTRAGLPHQVLPLREIAPAIARIARR